VSLRSLSPPYLHTTSACPFIPSLGSISPPMFLRIPHMHTCCELF
jgi:hypothetical protein